MLTMPVILDRWRRTREGTLALVRAIPAEYFEWRPREGTFSCGDVVRHMMQAEESFRDVIARGARGETWNPWGLTGSGEDRLRGARSAILTGAGMREYGDTADACLARWRDVQAETEATLLAIPDDVLNHTIEHAGSAITAPLWEICLMMMEHEIHHRGQLSAYLKMLEVDQPALLMR